MRRGNLPAAKNPPFLVPRRNTAAKLESRELGRALARTHNLRATGLAHKLQRRLQAQQNRSWEFDREEGILDGGRLARVVANPTTPLSFKIEHDTDADFIGARCDKKQKRSLINLSVILFHVPNT